MAPRFRSRSADDRVRRRSGTIARVAAAALVVAATSVPAAAGAQVGDDPFGGHDEVVTLASVMSGETRDVVARATSNASPDSMNVRLEVTNDTDEPVAVQIPAGTLLASEDDTEQTIAVAGPATELVAFGGDGGDTVLAPPGASSHELVAFCGQEYDYGPVQPSPLVYAGVALDPLPAVLTNVLTTDPYDPLVAQDAVWWVTDDPVVPVGDPAVRSLLEGVDTKSFAAAPVQVVPDDAYRPGWSGGSDLALGDVGGFDDTSGPGPDGGAVVGAFWLLVLVVAAGVGGVLWWQTRQHPAVAEVGGVPSGSFPAGWYPDPAGTGTERWWDGRSWTHHLR